jgi:hypothetical protein
MLSSSYRRNAKSILTEVVNKRLERDPEHSFNQLSQREIQGMSRGEKKGEVRPDMINSSPLTICFPDYCSSDKREGEEMLWLEPKAM